MYQQQRTITLGTVRAVLLLVPLVGMACTCKQPDGGNAPIEASRAADSLQDVATASRLADAAGLNPDKAFTYKVAGYLRHEYGVNLIMWRTSDTLELHDDRPIMVFVQNRGISRVFTLDPQLVLEDTMPSGNK